MIHFGCLGAAWIAPAGLMEPCASNSRGVVHAIAARDKQRAIQFAQDWKIKNVLNNYADVIYHREVDAVYIPLPISEHYRWTMAALQAGKHVLCEKSLASNAIEAEQMATTANDRGLILMDAFHYRYHPLFLRAKEIYQSGVLGEVQHITCEFHIAVTNAENIRLNYNTGGGVTMDIGCYPISWLRHLSDEEPRVESVEAITGPINVDVMLKAALHLPSGISASINGDMREGAEFHAVINAIGTQGQMIVVNPVVPHLGHELLITTNGHTSKETFGQRTTYSYQLDAFLDAIDSGEPPITDGLDGVKQMRVIDACYHGAGLPLRGL